MLIMLFLSGMPTAEGSNQSRYLRDPVVKAKYLQYRATTSPLIPMPPQLYGATDFYRQHSSKTFLLFEYIFLLSDLEM
jgi:hypothetical protein